MTLGLDPSFSIQKDTNLYLRSHDLILAHVYQNTICI